ncbi:hypothetical protein ACJMK2_005988 [Sinanodonta woodiana]|uniref:Allantoate amidinohydrolase n=1 Tax=Sinanodonta woodiana TaxID=1069815 RepID=A0ABD3VUJ1_SINWO
MAEPPTASLQVQPKFTELNDLVAEKVGGGILFATDDWFAVAENLLKSNPPEWREGVFTEFGKWMDGWETRRKRIPGHDWCIIQLGVPGYIYGVHLDTSYFTGNYVPKISIQAACLDKKLPTRKSNLGTAASPQDFEAVESLHSETWQEIVPMSPLQPGYKASCHNYFCVDPSRHWTHIRLNLYPDGGIARLRVYGRAEPNWNSIPSDKIVDLVAMEMGGMCIGYSNVHFGHARNLLLPNRADNMGEGWETARKPGRPAILEADSQGILKVPGSDWCAFRLGHPGVIKKIEIDTNHFKGNFPDSCWIEGCNIPESEEEKVIQISGSSPWQILLPAKKLSAHHRHFYEGAELNDCGVISHIRLSIAPDGGISRMRLFGYKL